MSSGKPYISLVVPCFNEADNAPILASELLPIFRALQTERTAELVFVDDGSRDGTGDLLEAACATEHGTRVVRHDRNRGLGAALRTGFAATTGEVVISTDSDGTYPFVLIPQLLALLTPEVDVVTSSCYHPLGGVENVPAYRVLLSKCASLMYRAILDRRIHTYTSLFRAYRREVLDTVTFRSDGFLAVTEILAAAIRHGFTVAELPCTLRVRRYGTSKAQIVRTIRAHLAFQFSLLFQRNGDRALAVARHRGIGGHREPPV